MPSYIDLGHGAFMSDMNYFMNYYPEKAEYYVRYVSSFNTDEILEQESDLREIVIFVPRNIAIERVIDLVLEQAHDAIVFEKILIVLEPGARLIISEKIMNGHDAVKLIRSVSMIVEDGAQLDMLCDNALSLSSSSTTTYTAHIQRDSIVTLLFSITGGLSTNLSINLLLHQPGAQGYCGGFYMLRDEQSCTITTNQRHENQSTTSTVIMHGALAHNASVSYHGLIDIQESGRQARASQRNKNILLHQNARAISIPSLEVKTDDVHCNHGSAVGRFDEDHYFYIQTRGLSEQIGRNLMLQGFFYDSIPVIAPALIPVVHKKITALCTTLDF